MRGTQSIASTVPLRALEPVHQVGVLRGPDEADQHRAFAQQFRFVHAEPHVGFGRAHFEHDVGCRPQRARVRHDFGAGLAVRIVGECGKRPRVALDRDLITELDELFDRLRRRRDAPFADVDLLGNADLHQVRLSICQHWWTRGLRRKSSSMVSAVMLTQSTPSSAVSSSLKLRRFVEKYSRAVWRQQIDTGADQRDVVSLDVQHVFGRLSNSKTTAGRAGSGRSVRIAVTASASQALQSARINRCRDRSRVLSSKLRNAQFR